MEQEQLLYRLTDPHDKYGSAGRAYTPEEWKVMPYNHRALFEPVNTGQTDYTLIENLDGTDTQVYLLDPAE